MTQPAPVIVMLCTAARGGMRSVVEGYREAGLFQRWNVQWLVTHDEGGAVRRMGLALRAWVTLVRLLLSGRVAAVHSHMAMRGSFWRKSLLNATARAFGVPVLAHLHGSEFKLFHAGLAPWGRRRVAREFERCHAVAVLSPGWAEFVRHIAPAARVVVLPNSVAVPHSPPPWPVAPPTVLLFLGAVGQRKGIYDLLPAFAQAAGREPGLRLLIGGNGEVDAAQAEARRLQIDDRVEFLGWVDASARESAWARAHAFVLPSHNEGLPMSVLEAMARGRPVLSTRVGGIPELVRDGVDGRLVAAGDRDALAAAIVEMATHPALGAPAGAAGRCRVQAEFGHAVVFPRLEDLYRDMGVQPSGESPS